MRNVILAIITSLNIESETAHLVPPSDDDDDPKERSREIIARAELEMKKRRQSLVSAQFDQGLYS